MSSANLESMSLRIAVNDSLYFWRGDLESLRKHAKDRYPDVVWEHDADDEGSSDEIKEQIWAHKAIIYARTSPKYQTSNLWADNLVSYSHLPYASLSSIKDLDDPFSSNMTLEPSVFLGSSRIHFKAPPPPRHKILLQNLWKMYCTPESELDIADDARSHFPSRLNSLQKDLLFIWTTRLSSDIQLHVSLTPKERGSFETKNGMYIVWSHRFILASRSPYFSVELQRLAEAEKKRDASSSKIQAFTLPSPPFTSISLFFTIGYIYTGTLNFSNRTCSLEQVFSIYKGAKFLMMDNLLNEIRMRIVEEYLHGLFNATLPQEEYGPSVGCKWYRMVEMGGCVCQQCAVGLPRILEFSLSGKIDDQLLARGARRAVVGMFGEGWCSRGFSQLPQHIYEIILDDMKEFIAPDNFFSLLSASEKALRQLQSLAAAWTDTVKKLVTTVRDMLDDVFLSQPEFCFECEEWMEIMHADRVGRTEEIRNKEEEMKWIFDAISRASRKNEARELYKTLVSSVLLRHHPTDPGSLFLTHPSHIRTQVKRLLKHFPPSSIEFPKFSGSDSDSSSSSKPDTTPSVTRRTRASSISSVSTNRNGLYHEQPASISVKAEDDDRSLGSYASNSCDVSIFSCPSSRTASTYYGFYYTRMALSMESLITSENPGS